MSERSLSCLPLASKDLQQLLDQGFMLVKDVVHVEPHLLARILKWKADRASRVIKQILQYISSPISNCDLDDTQVNSLQSPHAFLAKSGAELLEDMEVNLSLTTLCLALDNLLSSDCKTKNSIEEDHSCLFEKGIPLGYITEVVGVPGVGKTQLAMQLCTSTCIPLCFGGVGGETLYIDTEGSFMVERILQMTKSLESYLQSHDLLHNDGICTKTKGQTQNSKCCYSTNLVLKSLNYVRALSAVELEAIVYSLKKFCLKNKNIKLIVIDSIAFPYRGLPLSDMRDRAKRLQKLSLFLKELAFTENIAILLTNHMTTRINMNGNANAQTKNHTAVIASTVNGQVHNSISKGYMAPALGDAWSQTSTHRLKLYWNGSRRFAEILKSCYLRPGVVEYEVCADGVRDAEYPAVQTFNANDENNYDEDVDGIYETKRMKNADYTM